MSLGFRTSMKKYAKWLEEYEENSTQRQHYSLLMRDLWVYYSAWETAEHSYSMMRLLALQYKQEIDRLQAENTELKAQLGISDTDTE